MSLIILKMIIFKFSHHFLMTTGPALHWWFRGCFTRTCPFRCRGPGPMGPKQTDVSWDAYFTKNNDIWLMVWNMNFIFHNRRKFRSQTSDNMDRWKAEQGRCREKRKIRREKSRRERVRRKKTQMREKVGKSRFTVFFQWFVAPEGRKVGSLKRRVRSQLARWEMKIARRCGAKHISKSKCTKHTILGPLLEVEMLKKRTPLWREAHFQVKMHKTHHSRTTFGSWDVEKAHAVVARSTFPSQKC